MSYSTEHIRSHEECEELILAVNSLIDREYTPANVIAHRSYVYEYLPIAETFAFSIHCPGSDETHHLPGFELSEIPDPLARLTVDICERLGLSRGRVLFNAGRYPENSEELPAHWDGELFDFTVVPDVGQEVRSAVRPREVALLTLRNDSINCETRLHDADGNVIQPPNRAGDLLRFDNTVYQHSVPAAGSAPNSVGTAERPRWLRYTLGWRALEENSFFWRDGQPLRPIDFEEAIRLHENFLKDEWPGLTEADLDRGSFPFKSVYS